MNTDNARSTDEALEAALQEGKAACAKIGIPVADEPTDAGRAMLNDMMDLRRQKEDHK